MDFDPFRKYCGGAKVIKLTSSGMVDWTPEFSKFIRITCKGFFFFF